MGAQQSTRRLTVINDEASGVIKVCTYNQSFYIGKWKIRQNFRDDFLGLSALFQSWKLIIVQNQAIQVQSKTKFGIYGTKMCKIHDWNIWESLWLHNYQCTVKFLSCWQVTFL